MTCQPESGRILGELFRRNYFIERHPGPELRYQYHALFREFLATCARHSLSREAIDTVQRRAAELCEQAGDIAESFALFQAIGCAEERRRLIVDHGEIMIRHGRLQTLRAWIASLPADLRGSSGWISYWRGNCDLGSDPATARSFFSEAADLFAEVGNDRGGIKAIVGVIDSYYAEWSDFSALDSLIAQLIDHLDRQPGFANTTDELQAVAAALVALLYRLPAHPRLPELAARAGATRLGKCLLRHQSTTLSALRVHRSTGSC